MAFKNTLPQNVAAKDVRQPGLQILQFLGEVISMYKNKKTLKIKPSLISDKYINSQKISITEMFNVQMKNIK